MTKVLYDQRMDDKTRSEVRRLTKEFILHLTEKGLSKTEIARALNIGTVTLSKWISQTEAADVAPKKMNFIRLAVAAAKMSRLKKQGTAGIISSTALASAIFLPFGLVGLLVGSAIFENLFDPSSEKWKNFEKELEVLGEKNTWEEILSVVHRYWN